MNLGHYIKVIILGTMLISVIVRLEYCQEESEIPVTFTNPVVTDGADPWVIRYQDVYYYCFATDDRIWISCSKNLHEIGLAKPTLVWQPAEGNPWSEELWAPELHFFDNKWYIYVAADDGLNENHRMYVLKSDCVDPLSHYVLLGKIADSTDCWAIDGEYELWLTSDDAVRFWWDDSLMIDFWNDKGEDRTHRIKIYLKAGEKYPFRVEQSRQAEATKLRLAWRTPRMISKRYDPDLEYGMRNVYLPKSCDWYDFWTGQKIRGGRWIEKAVPIDVMPIYVRAGSILPMGPKLQYASEKPVNSIELRIYTGANAEFILYEDEGDSYAYEQGIYATIPIQWNEKDQTLIIGERQGKFPGILKNRIFKIIWVKEEHGIGEEISSKVDEMVTYDGNRVIIRRGT